MCDCRCGECARATGIFVGITFSRRLGGGYQCGWLGERLPRRSPVAPPRCPWSGASRHCAPAPAGGRTKGMTQQVYGGTTFCTQSPDGRRDSAVRRGGHVES